MVLFAFNSLIFSFFSCAFRGRPVELRLFFIAVGCVSLALYLSLQTPGVAADYFSYLKIFEGWNVFYREVYIGKRELVFVYIVDLATMLDFFEFIYICYGLMYGSVLAIGIFALRSFLNFSFLYWLAFGYLGLSANILSGIRYISVSFFSFALFAVCLKLMKSRKKINLSNWLIISLLLLCAQLNHSTAIFSGLLLLSCMFLAYKFEFLFDVRIKYKFALFFILSAIGIFIGLGWFFELVIEVFNLPFGRYLNNFQANNFSGFTLTNLISRLIWVGYVLLVFCRLPRRLDKAGIFCFWLVVSFSCFYMASIYIQPVFRMSNMTVLVGVAALGYLISFTKNPVILMQGAIFVSVVSFIARIWVGGGEYNYNVMGL